MTFKFIDLEVRNGVGWYRFNRAPRNSIHWQMLHELAPAFEALQAPPEVKVVVLASALDGYFSTGADIAAFNDANSTEMAKWVRETHRLAQSLRAAENPVLAAINGVAVGGGLEMALHADLRFVAEDARLGQPEINIGFIPPVAGTQTLVRLVGRSQAFRLLYGGEIIDARRAQEIGLADFVAAPGDLENEVQAYGEMLASRPGNAMSAIRRCLVDGGAVSFEDGMEIEKTQALALAGHANFHEGVAAFVEKRKPEWT